MGYGVGRWEERLRPLEPHFLCRQASCRRMPVAHPATMRSSMLFALAVIVLVVLITLVTFVAGVASLFLSRDSVTA